MEKEAVEAAASSGLLGWSLSLAAGLLLAVLAMWNVLFIFVLRHLNARTNKVEDVAAAKIDKLTTELHSYLPRTECSILSGNIEETVKKQTEAIEVIHGRIDLFMSQTCKHCADEVNRQDKQL